FRPKIFHTFRARMRGSALRSISCPNEAVSATAATATPYSEAPRNPSSKQPYGPALVVDVDVEGRRIRPVAGHRLHVAAERDDPARAGVGPEVSNGYREPGRRVRERRVVGQGEVRLRHADRQPIEPCLVE